MCGRDTSSPWLGIFKAAVLMLTLAQMPIEDVEAERRGAILRKEGGSTLVSDSGARSGAFSRS